MPTTIRPVTRADGKTAVQAAEAKRQLANTELEGRQKLWRWLIAGALVFVTLETLLAGWLAKRPAPQPSGETLSPAGRLS